ncbi:hypothetical protein [Burkholderia gladioli]|uniref:Uncharacterized protein n=1 Tax=Burkholderia gladioli (strain BSR3) TaxID=999541 RepID=F2LRR0_BURGS|nr:hypothetical protein [Burkholderia gladioli]AEA65554.1 hypothetical protein bgla_1p1630 [Burkholderia gladioli BSR3]MBW5286681.1 hypothetical protein [Burkholderia gladioli]
MQNGSVQAKWVVNDLCRVIVGFRNYTIHATRSKYVSFAIAEQPQMCDLLIRLSRGKLDDRQAAAYPAHLFEQLIDYGFLRSTQGLAPRQRFKRYFSLLNAGRFRSILFKGHRYYVASMVFMAFYSQRGNDYLRETVVLPAWAGRFADKVVDIVRNGISEAAFLALPARLRGRIEKHGLVTPEHRQPYLERFFAEHGRLDEALLDEVPAFYRHHLAAVSAPIDAYRLNDKLFFSSAELGDTLRGQIPNLDWAESCRPSVWVKNPVRDIVSMLWLSDAQLRELRALRAGQRQPAELDASTLRCFVASGLLHDPAQTAEARKAWAVHLREVARQLTESGCFTFEGILAPIELAISRKYLRFMKDRKFLMLDRANGKTEERFWVHRDEFTFYLQGQICTLLNQVLPSPIKTGHNALTIYESGATLPRHKDDVKAFSWVMSLPVDTRPDDHKEQAWPIYVETPKAIHKAMLQAGDGHVIDPQMPHWRDRLSDGRLSILLLWFVPHDYRGFVNGSWID